MAANLLWTSFFFATLILRHSLLSFSFESDELHDDDEEWGFFGSPKIEEVVSRRPRIPSSTETPTAADSKIQFQLRHSFGESEFSSAGVFTARLRSLPHGGQTLTKLRLSRNVFTWEEQKAFEELVKNDGFYRVQIAANVLNPGHDTVVSSAKARCLAASNLQERFDFFMDRGNVISVGYGASDCVQAGNLKYPTKWEFNSHIVLRSGEQAVRALTINNNAVEGADDGVTKKEPEKSFWGKYWMFIVPLGLILLNVITQVANIPDEQPSSQGSGQGAVQQRAVTTGPRRR